MNVIALRIKELIEKEKLTNKEFAQKLSINPSIISHILSGRNKVSLQVVEQIVKEFTNVSLDYLLLGSGAIYKEIPNVIYNSNLSEIQEDQEENKPDPILSIKAISRDAETTDKREENLTPTSIPRSQEIDQIIIFYADGSFKIYKP